MKIVSIKALFVSRFDFHARPRISDYFDGSNFVIIMKRIVFDITTHFFKYLPGIKVCELRYISGRTRSQRNGMIAATFLVLWPGYIMHHEYTLLVYMGD